MAFISGSITDANPGPALHALMAPALTTAGFTLVDTVTISTRTHKVWKSAAANNTQGLDWYLDIGYTTTGAGTISVIAFEYFDPATDLGYRGPYNSSSLVVDATTFSRYGATGSALETNWFGAQSAGSQTAITTTSFGYWIGITGDRVALMCSGAPSVVMYAGFYQPDPLYAAKAGAASYPLYSGKLDGTSPSASAGLTRIPPVTALTSTGWQGTVYAGNFALLGPVTPSGSTALYPASAILIALVSGGANLPAGRWGWFKDVFVVPTAGVVRGDTCTIDGASHVLSTTASGSSFAFQAA